MSINNTVRLFLQILPFLVIVDTINGFFLHKGMDSPLGICVKAVILLLSVRILTTSTKYRHIIGLFLIYLSFYLFSILLNTDSPIGSTVTLLMKFITIVLVYYTTVFLFRINKISEKKLVMAFYFNTIVLLANIFSGLFGIGYYAYGDMLGCKGFLFAHNEMSGMEAVLLGTSYFFLYQRCSNKKYIIILINVIFLFAALLVSTKAGILLVIIDLFLIPWSFKKNKGVFMSFIRTSKLKIIIVLCIIGYVAYQGYAILEYSGAIDRWTYFFEKDGTDSIYSARDQFWDEEKYEWIDGNIMVKLFGLGGNRSVEMDHADTLLNFGIIGIIIVYSFYFSLILKAYRNRNKSIYAKYLLIINVSILVASCFAGHLLTSGLMGIHFAIMNAMLYCNDVFHIKLNRYEGKKYIH